MSKTRLILVGGFLGAGKTTLLAEAARRLAGQGKRVGLVANDQAPDLIDTELFRQTGAGVAEVAGGCFCCRFPDLIEAVRSLVREVNAEVVLGEPVGSCTDLSATVLQPLKHRYPQEIELGPFSVLVDTSQVRALLRFSEVPGPLTRLRFPENVLHIYQTQLEEADLIVLNKVDLVEMADRSKIRELIGQRFPDKPVFEVSALNGQGIDDWLAYVTQAQPVGTRLASVDYEIYAAGEATLGWLNASARLKAREEVVWSTFAGELLEEIRARLRERAAEIAHLKIFLATPGASVVGNLTADDSPVSVRGQIDPARRTVRLLVNARVRSEPETLQHVVKESVLRVAGSRIVVEITGMRSFFPARPQPTYRYDRVV